MHRLLLLRLRLIVSRVRAATGGGEVGGVRRLHRLLRFRTEDCGARSGVRRRVRRNGEALELRCLVLLVLVLLLVLLVLLLLSLELVSILVELHLRLSVLLVLRLLLRLLRLSLKLLIRLLRSLLLGL